MTLPASGAITMAQVNTELNISPSTTAITLNNTNVRILAGIPSGAISLDSCHGKSWDYMWVLGIRNTVIFNPLWFVDSSGNAYFSALLSGSLDGVIKTNPVASNSFVVSAYTSFSINVSSSGNVFTGVGSLVCKFNSSGTQQWNISLSNPGSYNYSALTYVDSSDNSYVNGTTSSVGPSSLIVKVNSSGAVTWSRSYLNGSSGSYTPSSYGTCVDGSSNVYAFGSDYHTPSANSCVYTVKYNSSGTQQASYAYYSSGLSINLSAAYGDSSGNVYFCCTNVSGVVTIIKTNSSGSVVWCRQSSGFYSATISRVDPDGNVYTCYRKSGDSANNLYIQKYNSSGVMQWQRLLTVSGQIPSGSNLDGSVSIQAGVTTDYSVVGYWFQSPTGSTVETILCKLPSDGSRTGTYSVMTSPVSISVTYATTSFTEQAGPAFSVATTYYTSSNLSVTSSSVSFSSTSSTFSGAAAVTRI